MRQACPEAHPVHWGSQREEAAQPALPADRAKVSQFKHSFPFVVFGWRARRLTRRPLGRSCDSMTSAPV